jgi:hypothetical protein
MPIIYFPVWLVRMPEGPQKDVATKRFLMWLASVYNDPVPSIGKLACQIGIPATTLRSQMTTTITVAPISYRKIVEILHPLDVSILRDL